MEPGRTSILDTEPINPLYTGQYAVGPYTVNQVAPSGSDAQQVAAVVGSYYTVAKNLSTNSASASCDTAADGVETAPAAIAAEGWSTGTLCAYGHAAWFGLASKRTTASPLR